MYYKLTMSDGRKMFIPKNQINPRTPTPELTISSKPEHSDFAIRLAIIRRDYPDCIDWEMVEPEEVPIESLQGNDIHL